MRHVLRYVGECHRCEWEHDSFEWVMSHTRMRTWLIRMCDIPYSDLHAWHDSFRCENLMPHSLRYYCKTYPIYTCDMTHSHLYVWHDSSRCEHSMPHSFSWELILLYTMTHSYMWHDSFSFVRVTWLIYTCDMTIQVRAFDFSFSCKPWLILIYMCDMPLSDASTRWRGGGLGSSTIFKKINEPYAPS